MNEWEDAICLITVINPHLTCGGMDEFIRFPAEGAADIAAINLNKRSFVTAHAGKK
jgi:hypothetical protein